MPALSLCFRIHQPYQFKNYGFNDIGKLHTYEDKVAMAAIMDELADNCYLPANRILLEQIKKTKGKFRFAFSISGTTLELFEEFRPDLINSFRQLVKTGCVEILGETFYNSLSWIHSENEFERQVKKHEALVKRTFDYEPVVFRNTELLYNNEFAKYIAALGYRGLVTDGNSNILEGRSPNQVYAAPDNGDFGILLRNAELSEDIACWFGKAKGSRYALTAEKFAERVFHNNTDNSCSINAFLDYETFGIHKTAGNGIFRFLEEIPHAILVNPRYSFKTPAESLDHCYPKDIYDVPGIISINSGTAETELWHDNIRQNNLIKKLYKLENLVQEAEDDRILNTWGKLQSADHFCFIEGCSQGEKDMYRFINKTGYTIEKYKQFSNILTDFEILLIRNNVEKNRSRFSQYLSSMLF